MSRERSKGTAFENQVRDYLNEAFGTDTFHRLGLHGSLDEGDVWGLFSHGRRVVVEAKNHRRMELSEWLGEAERERGNADALAKTVWVKRRGVGPATFGRTYVVMEADDLVALLTGERGEEE